MEIIFTQKAIKDLDQWKKSGDVTKLKRIRALIESISETHMPVSVNQRR